MYCIKYMNETRSFKQIWKVLQNFVWRFYILGVASKVFQQLWPFSTQQLQRQLITTSPKRQTLQNFSILYSHGRHSPILRLVFLQLIAWEIPRFIETMSLNFSEHLPSRSIPGMMKNVELWKIHFNSTNKLCCKTNSTLLCINNRWSAC